jgi:hypothetical protein
LEEIYFESKYGWMKEEIEKINNMLLSAKENPDIQFIKISYLSEAEVQELSTKYLLARIRNYFTTISSPYCFTNPLSFQSVIKFLTLPSDILNKFAIALTKSFVSQAVIAPFSV